MCKETLKEKLGSTDNCYSNKTAAEEKGRKFRLILPKGEEACRVNVDDCLLTQSEKTGKKCDFLFYRCKTKDCFFVELKGQDISRAFEQITTTIKLLKKELDVEKHQCFGFVSASKVSIPNFSSVKQKFEKEFKRDYGKEIRISSSSSDWKLD